MYFLFFNKYPHSEFFCVETYDPDQGGKKEGYYFTTLQENIKKRPKEGL